MRILILLFILFFQISYSNPPFWSKTGHRVIGEVAQNHLKSKTKRSIKKLLGNFNLAGASNFADEIKADKRYRKFSAWHYVNFPKDKKYGDVSPSEHGDLIIGINTCIKIIKQTNSSREDKIFYLKMLIHLVGDLHQPMHVGRLEDKGGNDIHVLWFNKESNLHKVWDYNMINDFGMSYSELAGNLPSVSKKEKKEIQQGTIIDWVEESQDIANKLYESVEKDEKLYYQYGYKWWGTVEAQLQKGGIRLAKVLNDTFK